MRSILIASIFFSSFSALAVENSVGTTGYIRLQTSLQDEKANVCFKAPGAGSKYRLGNECETWIELGLYDTIHFDNGVILHNQIRPAFTGANNKNIEYLRLDELYSEISNIFDNTLFFWVGRRFYDRRDSHINDYFYLNLSGDGAGFRNLDIGGYKLSYSYIFDRLDPPSVAGDEKVHFDSHDVRVTKPTERGEWSVFANRMEIHSKTFNTAQHLNVSSGYATGFLYKDTRLMGELFGMEGESISALFYGEGVAKGAGSTSPYLQEAFIDAVLGTSEAIEAAETWRFVNHNAFENEQWGLISNFMYEKRREVGFSGSDQTWISAGVRPYWFFHKNGRLVLEEGIDHIEDNAANKTYLLTKTTVALEAALNKGVWKRPVVRLFYTYADWSEDAVGLVSSYYPTQTHGDNVGIQLEYWW